MRDAIALILRRATWLVASLMVCLGMAVEQSAAQNPEGIPGGWSSQFEYVRLDSTPPGTIAGRPNFDRGYAPSARSFAAPGWTSTTALTGPRGSGYVWGTVPGSPTRSLTVTQLTQFAALLRRQTAGPSPR